MEGFGWGRPRSGAAVQRQVSPDCHSVLRREALVALVKRRWKRIMGGTGWKVTQVWKALSAKSLFQDNMERIYHFWISLWLTIEVHVSWSKFLRAVWRQINYDDKTHDQPSLLVFLAIEKGESPCQEKYCPLELEGYCKNTMGTLTRM